MKVCLIDMRQTSVFIVAGFLYSLASQRAQRTYGGLTSPVSLFGALCSASETSAPGSGDGTLIFCRRVLASFWWRKDSI